MQATLRWIKSAVGWGGGGEGGMIGTNSCVSIPSSHSAVSYNILSRFEDHSQNEGILVLQSVQLEAIFN